MFTVNEKTGAALVFSARGEGKAMPREEEGGEMRRVERGEVREESRLQSCREGLMCAEGTCLTCHES